MTCLLQSKRCILLTRKTIGRSLFKELTITENANKSGNKQMCASGVDKRKAGWGVLLRVKSVTTQCNPFKIIVPHKTHPRGV